MLPEPNGRIPSSGVARTNILGVGVSAIDMERALDTIERWVVLREARYVCVTGVHGIMESVQDESLRRIHNQAGMVTPDGVPLVWLSRLWGSPNVRKVCGPDLLPACCERGLEKGFRHFFYGGTEGVANLLSERLHSRFHGLSVVGTYCPPFRSMTEAEDGELVRRINDAGPDIVWVGLSTPKQERWMAAHVGRLSAPVLLGVGAAFDVHAGLKSRAPAWMQRSGLEWLFRLRTEPRRLWRRYLVNNPAFVWHVALQATGVTRYEMDGLAEVR
jgi:N-acetylglucosaminyldiphosphoundecaprenol N-acetyl-beta-D-mannosaminyltransferase